MSDNSPQSLPRPGLSSVGIVKKVRCDYQKCPRPAVLRLDVHFFCVDHLVSHCYKRLESYQQQTSRNLVLAANKQAKITSFLDECASKLAAFLVARPELPNLERARLFDVLLWATELDRKCPRAQKLRL